MERQATQRVYILPQFYFSASKQTKFVQALLPPTTHMGRGRLRCLPAYKRWVFRGGGSNAPLPAHITLWDSTLPTLLLSHASSIPICTHAQRNPSRPHTQQCRARNNTTFSGLTAATIIALLLLFASILPARREQQKQHLYIPFWSNTKRAPSTNKGRPSTRVDIVLGTIFGVDKRDRGGKRPEREIERARERAGRRVASASFLGRKNRRPGRVYLPWDPGQGWGLRLQLRLGLGTSIVERAMYKPSTPTNVEIKSRGGGAAG